MFLSFIIFLGYMLGSRLVTAGKANHEVLFNFQQSDSLGGWVESSDTVREVGMSKAALVIQKTQVFQRAVFFTMLNPQPNGAAFAGVNYESSWNLANFQNLAIHARGQGANSQYKVVLRHRNQNREPYPSYEQMFTAPMDTFDTVSLSFANFKPYYRGKPLNESSVDALDRTSITSLGIQVYGGVYQPVKQSGVSSLEMNWIKAE